LPICSNGCL